MTHDKNIISEAINLTKTQRGYVPLNNRFKSFPKDSENEPITDERFYFNNYANQTLEHATIDLLYPTPNWLRRRLQKQHLIGFYLITDDGKFLIGNNKYLVGAELK